MQKELMKIYASWRNPYIQFLEFNLKDCEKNNESRRARINWYELSIQKRDLYKPPTLRDLPFEHIKGIVSIPNDEVCVKYRLTREVYYDGSVFGVQFSIGRNYDWNQKKDVLYGPERPIKFFRSEFSTVEVATCEMGYLGAELVKKRIPKKWITNSLGKLLSKKPELRHPLGIHCLALDRAL